VALALGSLAYDIAWRSPSLPPDGAVTGGGTALALAIPNVIGVSAVVFGVVAFAVTSLRREHASAERLLLNILPPSVAERIKGGERLIADSIDEATILFADVVGFTRLAAGYPADNLVGLLNRIFTRFDDLVERWQAEKIKTIGDAYMAACGLPQPRSDHAAVAAELALEMRAIVAEIAKEQGLVLQLRIGIHTGPVVAGIIGSRKFAYDIWGDTVNVASRMESTAPAGAIQVSERTARLLEGRYELEAQEPVAVRGRGELTTYLLDGRQAGAAATGEVVPIAGAATRLRGMSARPTS
jgi:class 3 adenylate cyclase